MAAGIGLKNCLPFLGAHSDNVHGVPFGKVGPFPSLCLFGYGTENLALAAQIEKLYVCVWLCLKFH